MQASAGMHAAGNATPNACAGSAVPSVPGGRHAVPQRAGGLPGGGGQGAVQDSHQGGGGAEPRQDPGQAPRTASGH